MSRVLIAMLASVSAGGYGYFDNPKTIWEWRAANSHHVDGWVIPMALTCPRMLIIRSRYYGEKIIPDDILMLGYDFDRIWPAGWPDSIASPGFLLTLAFAPYREAPQIVDNLHLEGDWGEYCSGIAKFIAYCQPIVTLLAALKLGFGNYLLGLVFGELVGYMCCSVFYTVGWHFTPNFIIQLLFSWRLFTVSVLLPLNIMRSLFTFAKTPPLLRRQSSSERVQQEMLQGLRALAYADF